MNEEVNESTYSAFSYPKWMNNDDGTHSVVVVKDVLVDKNSVDQEVQTELVCISNQEFFALKLAGKEMKMLENEWYRYVLARAWRLSH